MPWSFEITKSGHISFSEIMENNIKMSRKWFIVNQKYAN